MPGIIEPQGPPPSGEPARPLGARLLWFLGLALGGAGVVAVVAYLLRGLMRLG